jgi:hypothetical protein
MWSLLPLMVVSVILRICCMENMAKYKGLKLAKGLKDHNFEICHKFFYHFGCYHFSHLNVVDMRQNEYFT